MDIRQLYANASIAIVDEDFQQNTFGDEDLPIDVLNANPFISIHVVGIFHRHFMDYASMQPNWSLADYKWPQKIHNLENRSPIKLWPVYIDANLHYFITTIPAFEYVQRLGRQVYQLMYRLRHGKPEVETWYFQNAFQLFFRWSGLQDINVQDRIIITGDFDALREALRHNVPPEKISTGDNPRKPDSFDQTRFRF